MWKAAVVLISLIAVSAAYQAIAQLEAKPEKFQDQEGCYLSEEDVFLPIGQEVPSKKDCISYRCGEENVFITGCGAVYAEPPQRVVEDKSLPYPDCCPQIVDPNNCA